MDCIGNCWRQLFFRQLTRYSWIHGDAVNFLGLLWKLLPSASNLVSSHSQVVFLGISLHNSEIAMPHVGFLNRIMQKSVRRGEGLFRVGFENRCFALDNWLLDRYMHLLYVWNYNVKED